MTAAINQKLRTLFDPLHRLSSHVLHWIASRWVIKLQVSNTPPLIPHERIVFIGFSSFIVWQTLLPPSNSTSGQVSMLIPSSLHCGSILDAQV